MERQTPMSFKRYNPVDGDIYKALKDLFRAIAKYGNLQYIESDFSIRLLDNNGKDIASIFLGELYIRE